MIYTYTTRLILWCTNNLVIAPCISFFHHWICKYHLIWWYTIIHTKFSRLSPTTFHYFKKLLNERELKGNSTSKAYPLATQRKQETKYELTFHPRIETWIRTKSKSTITWLSSNGSEHRTWSSTKTNLELW